MGVVRLLAARVRGRLVAGFFAFVFGMLIKNNLKC
jgi:hypothetical protein